MARQWLKTSAKRVSCWLPATGLPCTTRLASDTRSLRRAPSRNLVRTSLSAFKWLKRNTKHLRARHVKAASTTVRGKRGAVGRDTRMTQGTEFDVDRLDHEALAAALLGPVLEAGAVEMRYYRSGVEVEAKADNSPVTAADREAEAILLEALSRIAPQVPVVAEEAVAEGRMPKVARSLFLVDPLDGTREFIHKRGEFTVNIALVVDGAPRFGIVYAPAIGELYVTLGPRRCGFAVIAPEAAPATLAAAGFRDISTRSATPSTLAAVASRSHLTPETEALLARYPVKSRRDAGSSLKFCLLARGEADLYPRLGPTMEWDIAAGHAVLEAAGGGVVDLDGHPLRYGKAEEGYKSRHFVAFGRREVLDMAAPAP